MEESEQNDSSGQPTIRRFHVLLVEDDEVTLHVVERLLRGCNYDVTLARNGREALEVLGQATPDLILTDLAMPELSGLELVEGVLHNERYSSIPVVVMSSNDSFKAVKEAMEAGAQDFLIKPIRRNELTTLWRHVWRQNPGRMDGQQAAAQQAEAGSAALQVATEPSGRTQASAAVQPGPSRGQQQQQAPVQQLEQQQLEGVPERAPSGGGDATDASDTSTQPASGMGEGEVPLAAADRLQGVLAAAAAVERAVPPAHCGPSVDLNIVPLNLAPPPLFVAGGKARAGGSMPRGLAELAELGARREVERAHSAAVEAETEPSAAATHSSLGALHHSSTSAFTHFAALVPPPCPRGGWSGLGLGSGMGGGAHSALTGHSMGVSQLSHPVQGCEPSSSSRVVPLSPYHHHQQQQTAAAAAVAAATAASHLQQQQQQQQEALRAATAAAWAGPSSELLQQQQQRFIQAIQAAIQQHQAATKHMSADAQAHRRAAVEKFRQKRKQRTFEKKVRYESRKKLAEARPRIKGQFVKAEVAQQYQALMERGDAEGADALLKQLT